MALKTFQQIVSAVQRRMDSNTELRVYKDGLREDIDAVYQEVSDGNGWRFFEVTTRLTLYGEVTGEAVTRLISTTNVSNLRRLSRAGTSTTHNFYPRMLGQRFTYDGEDYTIVGLGSLISADAQSYAFAYLDRPLAASIIDATDWTINYDTYRMPADCVEFLGWSSRDDDRGQLLMIDRRHEERLYLDKGDTGTPWVLIEDDTLSDAGPSGIPKLTAAFNAGSELLNNTTYAYCFTFYAEGRESPPSLPAEVTTGAVVAQRVTVDDVPEPRWWDGAAWQNSGRLVRIYRRDVTNQGPWYRVAEQADSTSFDDDDLLPSGQTDWATVPRLFPVSSYRYVRAHYTANETLTIQLRYRRRPPPLVARSDTPEWPERYHDLITHLSLARILGQHGDTNNAQFWQNLADPLLERMKARYLANEAAGLQFGKRQMGAPRRHTQNGVPSLTG